MDSPHLEKEKRKKLTFFYKYRAILTEFDEMIDPAQEGEWFPTSGRSVTQ